MERKRTDLKPLWRDREGIDITQGVLSQIFRGNHNKPEKQIPLALNCIFNHGVDPRLVLSWIDDPIVKTSVQNWCEARNVKFDDPKSEDDEEMLLTPEIRRFFAEDEVLINVLGPYLSQVDLARVIEAMKFRQMDETSKQVLISGIYHMLGSYLGPGTHYRQNPPPGTMLPLPQLPPELFANGFVTTILKEGQRKAAMPFFNRDLFQGYQYLAGLKELAGDDEYKTQFVIELETYFREAFCLQFDCFRDVIAGHKKDLPFDERGGLFTFPSRHQIEYAYRLIHKKIGPLDLLIGATRTQKSGQALCGLEAVRELLPEGNKQLHALIVCPAGVRDTWEREIREKYAEVVDIVRIDNVDNYISLMSRNVALGQKIPQYMIMGYSFLSLLEYRGLPSLEGFKKIGMNAIVADEAHSVNNPDANCTEQLIEISRLLPEKAPRIAMTATGVINSQEDLDAPVRFLMPYRYPKPGDFTRAARNNPAVIASLLHSQQLLTRQTREDVFGNLMPEVVTEEIPVPLSNFHQTIYDFVHQDSTIEDNQKRGMLRQASLDPLLVRRHYHPAAIIANINRLESSLEEPQDETRREVTRERIKTLQERLLLITELSNCDEAKQTLEEAFGQFKKWQFEQDPQAQFNEDFLVQAGFGKVVLWAFFNFPNGVRDLIYD